MRETQDAIVGAVTGPLTAPRSLLLGRLDAEGRLQYTGRSTTLSATAGTVFAGLLSPATSRHPWTGWTFSTGWGTSEPLNVTLVKPDLVVEVGVDVARDGAGRWRHPARWHRIRPDLTPDETPLSGS
ncbi:ATP dependent DNA ligase [Streptomyces cadmiisoli]|uniref:ATP dependent DNA ligase n=1 Tax=Streptomyces cadmiisoli TaxID=2184053 RepID=UPI00365A0C27